MKPSEGRIWVYRMRLSEGRIRVYGMSLSFPNTKIEVFSYEELCFYIYNNIALISEEYIAAPMFNWIEEELGLVDLGKMLREMKEKDSHDLTDLLTAILTYKEYYTIPEVK